MRRVVVGGFVKTSYRTIPAYVTKDGSEIRELMHPAAVSYTHLDVYKRQLVRLSR